MRIRSFLNVLGLAALAGCIPTGACTLIGCHDGLVVAFNRTPTGPLRIEAVVPNDARQYVIECADAATCETLFPEFSAAQVTLRVTTAQGTVSQSFSLRYEPQYPNGRQCGEVCRQATATVQLPA